MLRCVPLRFISSQFDDTSHSGDVHPDLKHSCVQKNEPLIPSLQTVGERSVRLARYYALVTSGTFQTRWRVSVQAFLALTGHRGSFHVHRVTESQRITKTDSEERDKEHEPSRSAIRAPENLLHHVTRVLLPLPLLRGERKQVIWKQCCFDVPNAPCSKMQPKDMGFAKICKFTPFHSVIVLDRRW